MASGQISTADTANGADFSFRMTIDERYKEMATARRNLTISTKVQLCYILVRSIWKFLPSFLTADLFPLIDVAIMLVGVSLFFLYRYSFGYGKAQHEKLGAIMTCTILTMFLLAECFLTFWLYHINFGPKSIHPEAVAAYPPIPKTVIAAAGLTGTTAGNTLLAVLDPLEKLLDVVGIVTLLLTVMWMREYALESRDLKREQEERRNAGTKAE